MLAQRGRRSRTEPSDPSLTGSCRRLRARERRRRRTPVNPQGSLRDWNRGTTSTPAWENWDTGASGVSRVGFGLDAAYSAAPARTSTHFMRELHAARPAGRADVGERGARRHSRDQHRAFACAFRRRYIMPSIERRIRIHRLATRSDQLHQSTTGPAGQAAASPRRRSHRRRGARARHVYRPVRSFRRSAVRLRLHELRQRLRDAGRRLQLRRVRHVPQEHDDRDDSRRSARSRRPVTSAHGS